MLITSDAAFRSAAVALDGLAERQRASAENIANIQTPGYLARTVEFEDTLRQQMLGSRVPDDGAITSGRSNAATNTNGNNVQLDEEMVRLQDTQLRYQVMSRFVQSRFDHLRTASRSAY